MVLVEGPLLGARLKPTRLKFWVQISGGPNQKERQRGIWVLGPGTLFKLGLKRLQKKHTSFVSAIVTQPISSVAHARFGAPGIATGASRPEVVLEGW